MHFSHFLQNMVALYMYFGKQMLAGLLEIWLNYSLGYFVGGKGITSLPVFTLLKSYVES